MKAGLSLYQLPLTEVVVSGRTWANIIASRHWNNAIFADYQQ